MNSPEATVILKSPDGSWTSVGTEDPRGIVAEGITLTANEFGPDTCSFSLRREASVTYPDLLAFNQADVLIGGQLVWGGRIWEAPLTDGDEDVIAVQGRGWSYHLDDDLLSKHWVTTTVSDWRDMRSFAGQNRTFAVEAPSVTAVGGCPSFGWPNNTHCATSTGVGLMLDLGPDRLAKRIVVNWNVVNGNAAFTLYARAHQAEDTFTGVSTDAFAVAMEAATPIQVGTFSTAYRYVSLFLFRDDGLTAVTGTDHYVQIYSIKVFVDAAYESGNASILKASDVVEDVLASGAVPLLDDSTTRIGATSFSIPEFAPSGYQTPRSLISAANAYEGNLFGVDAERRLFLRERDEIPKTEVGSWPGSSFQDASTNSGEGLYNRVIVQGTGAASEPVSVSRYSADLPSTPESAFSDVLGLANPGFETNTTGWTLNFGDTFTRVTGSDVNGNVFFAGAAAAALNTDASGTASVSTALSNLTVGRVHSVRFQYRRNATTNPIIVTAEVTSGATVLGRAVDDSNPAAGVWAQPQVSFAAPATTATLTISVGFKPTVGSVAALYLDDVHVFKVGASLLDRQGFIRTAVLSVESALTPTAAQQLGDIWLNERTTPPLKGSLVVSGWGGARYINGGDVHPSEMLLRYGQRIRLGQLVDPSTGDQGRDGIIKSVSYSHDTETASLELDSERGRLETLLSRLAVVTGQIR